VKRGRVQFLAGGATATSWAGANGAQASSAAAAQVL